MVRTGRRPSERLDRASPVPEKTAAIGATPYLRNEAGPLTGTGLEEY
jgi:hypothetical protein